MDLPERDEAKSWEGSTVVDRDGEVLGRCTGVFADTDTGATEWLSVDVQGHRRSFVPALGATESAGTVRVPFVRGTVLAAPRVGDAEQLSMSDEVLLYRHYDVTHTSTASGSVLPADTEALGSPESDPAVTSAPVLPALGGSPLPSSTQSVDVPTVGGPSDDLAPPALRRPTGSEATQALTTAPASGLTSGTATPAMPPIEPTTEPVAVLTPAPAPAPARPAVVPPSAITPTPRPVPVPTPASSASPSSGTAPLAVLAGVVAAAALALKAWERRAARRRSPQARAARLTRTVQTGSARAARGASRQLADASSAASRAGLRASSSTRTVAASSTGAAAKASRRAGKRTARTTRTLARTTSRSTRDVTSTVGALPKSVAKKGQTVARKGRRARRSVAGNLWDLVILSGTGAGYVLGARAGRERYDQINQQASELATSPQVQALTRVVADPERRQQVIAPVKRSTSALAGRRQGPA